MKEAAIYDGAIGMINSIFALTHAPPTYQARRAPTQAPALFTIRLARNARGYTSARSISFYAIWVCISPSSSSRAGCVLAVPAKIAYLSRYLPQHFTSWL